MPDALLKLLVKDKLEKYAKEGKLNLRGKRNEVRADERQTGSGKLRGERLKIIIYSRQGPTSTQS